MPGKKKADDISREEDFRDYDDRNIDEGWPYDDAGSARPVDNAAYGDPKANFDTNRNRGYQVDSVERDGSEERLVDTIRPGTKGIEEADDLEERVTDAIEELDMIDMASIDVHVEDGTVTLEGAVDDAPTSRKIARRIQRVASHIPDDD